MKAVLALSMLAAVGLGFAGCGSETNHTTGPVTLAGTTTIAHMPTGTPVHCKHGPGAQVPPPGQGVAGNADGPSSSSEIQITHQRDGSVVVSCRSG